MLIRSTAAITLCLIQSLLTSCDSSYPPRTLYIDGSAAERAIQPCSLPLSASIIAYLSVGLDRYLMTPDVNGQSASITLTLTTGDIVSVEIVYVIDGDSHTIARASAEVPATGHLNFEDTDFDLVDDNANSVPDCLELAPNGAVHAEQNRQQSADFRFSRHTPDTRITTRPTSTGLSTVARETMIVNTGSNASCALDTGIGSLWFWWLPLTQLRVEYSDLSFLELDLKVLGFQRFSRSVNYFVVDYYGRSWGESLSIRPGTDWTRVVLPIKTAFDAFSISKAPASSTSRSPEPQSAEPGVYILGDFIAGTGDGSCISLIPST